ncbi:MAG: GGDEF domain-containing protein [Oscillospiraceae bacterium]|nr:GGDEF domain-containing protein [Oscillospiraceae bacterium]
MNSTIARVAMALLIDYTSVYFIDLKNDHYESYSTNRGYQKLELQSSGTDFFADCQRDIRAVVCDDDWDMVSRALSRENLLSRLRENGGFSLIYRLMIDGQPVFHAMRILHDTSEEGDYMVLGVQNVDETVRHQEELRTISERSLIFSHIAESLANQYGMIYYIDTETDEYIEFTAAREYKEFNISPVGSDFFGTSQRNVGMIVHPSDRERVFEALDKKTMLRKLEENGSFTLTYQLLLAEGSSYTRMSVFWANDRKHLIMTVMNIDSEIQRENAIKRMVAENAVFSQIAESLANQYDTIYYVDMLTDHYTEFSSTDVYKSLQVRPSGEDFFRESIDNIKRVIYPEDRDEVLRLLHKPTMMQMLQGKHMITHTYRLLVGDGIMYARMSVIWANDNKHLIIGVMNIDQEVRREREVQEKLHVASVKAYRDGLTGVKNKAAYTETEDALQEQIEAGSVRPFSIVVCDVNGLKAINDGLGHIEGDAYIRSASELICHTWSHSPVFRIGGDEFVVVPQGGDYDNRHALLQQMKDQVRENMATGKVVIAVGMSDYDAGSDTTVSQVFERADNRMYQNKTALKS